MKSLKNYLNEDKIPGGLGDDKEDKDFDSKQLEIGIEHEMEHTNDIEVAKEIAKDHLSEDPNYYTKLKDIENDEDTFSIDVVLDNDEEVNERMRKPRKREINSGKVTRVATENLFGENGSARPLAEKMFKLYKREIRQVAKDLGVSISQVKQFKITIRDYDNPDYDKQQNKYK
jgi:hypothetical protein